MASGSFRDSAMFVAFAVAFSTLGFLFAKNLLRARKSAEIYNRGILVRRTESPVTFWITVVFYGFATAFVAVGAGVCLFAFFLTVS
jgi:hypothetical protein